MAELTVPRVDFSSLGELPAVWKQGQADALRKQTLANLGQGVDVDANSLLKSGDLSLAQLGVAMRNRSSDDIWRQQEAQRQASQFQQSLALQKRASDRADDPTPAGFIKAPDGTGVQPLPGGPADPTYIARRNAADGSSNFLAQVNQRKQVAAELGITEGHPAYPSFIATGKMPREDQSPLSATDKKAILEADEGVMMAKSAIDALQKAKELSTKAFSGPMAEKRGYAASFLGESSDIGKGGIATAELNNVVTTNALSQLKAIFGGAPTEGERKILLDIQGSVNMPHEVRAKIYDRARQMAERRLQFNEQRANELRGGQFYKAKQPNAVPATSDPAAAPAVVNWQTYFGSGN